MNRALIAGIAACLAVVAAWLLLSGTLDDSREATRAERVLERARASTAARPRADQSSRDIAAALRPQADADIDLAKLPLPGSLEDTEIDGGLAADDDGNLIVNQGVRALFDYFLSATGEEPAATIEARILAEIDKRLEPKAAAQARDLLDRYLEYRKRTRRLFEEGDAATDLAERLEQVRQLRREVFGPDAADGLFGDEEAYDFVAVAQHEIGTDPSLSSEEKQRLIAELDEQLPEDQRRARDETTKPLRMFREVEEMRDSGASDEDVQAVREQYFGEEAAERLAVVDRERGQWDTRMQDYRAARREIEAGTMMSASEREAAIERLRAKSFSGPEQIRVRALDRIEKSRTGGGN